MSLTGNVYEFDELREHALGWRGLLDGVRAKLETLNVDVHVWHVKEKFGGLRVSVHLPDDTSDAVQGRVNLLVDTAENASYLLCYLCGGGVTHVGSGWWKRYFCAQHDTEDLRRELTARQNARNLEAGAS